MNLVPLVVTLSFGKMTMQHSDRILRFGEPALEAFDCLRRQRNLRDENDCSATAIECGPNPLQINLRFARACHAVQQNRTRILG